MTREEAIKMLDAIVFMLPQECYNEETETALTMARNSLKAWDKVKAKIRKGKYATKDLPERALIYANGWDDGLELAIDIIDKYKEE